MLCSSVRRDQRAPQPARHPGQHTRTYVYTLHLRFTQCYSPQYAKNNVHPSQHGILVHAHLLMHMVCSQFPSPQYAKNNVHPSQHGILAYFLASGGGDGDKPHGANNALTLPGLTLLEEAVLRLQLSHWQLVRVCACV